MGLEDQRNTAHQRKSEKNHINRTSSGMVHLEVRSARSSRGCGVSSPPKFFGLFHFFVIIISEQDKALICFSVMDTCLCQVHPIRCKTKYICSTELQFMNK